MDDYALASWEGKVELVRDKVRGVAKGYSNGLYLWGAGGTSKTHTVEETLRQLGTPFQTTNTQVTARGLFNKLREFHDATHVIDDVARLGDGQGVCRLLLAALDSKEVRRVTWEVAGGEDFVFEGGVILIANYDLNESPQLRALASRVTKHHHRPSHDEMAAVMRRIAARGYSQQRVGGLSPAQCQEVLDAVFRHLDKMRRGLDIRRLINGFRFRLQWENGDSRTHWETLVESDMREGAVPTKGARASRKASEVAFLRGLPASLTPAERFRAWQEATGGKSQAAMYRRLTEMRESGKVGKSFSDSHFAA